MTVFIYFLKNGFWLLVLLCVGLSCPVLAQEETDETVDEEIEEAPTDESAADAASVAQLAEELLFSIGVTFQQWSPFTEVTSNLIGDLAGISGKVVNNVETDVEGDNAGETLDEVSSDSSPIVTLEMRGDSLFDQLHVDLSEGTDLNRLNPFQSRATESSEKKDLDNSLKREQTQTSRLSSQLKLLQLSDALSIVYRFSEENFVSQVTPSRDTLFINFAGSDALIEQRTKIQLETSFEEKMSGISDFMIPGTDIPVGFLGYFELVFQKPVLLPLSESTEVFIDGKSSKVDAVIIFPQFSAVGWMVEWFKSKEDGFDLSGNLKFGHGNIDLGQGTKEINTLLLDDQIENQSLFSRSANILFSGGLLRLSYLSSALGEFSFAGEWRVFVLDEEFNGVKEHKPLSVDWITFFEVLYRF